MLLTLQAKISARDKLVSIKGLVFQFRQTTQKQRCCAAHATYNDIMSPIQPRSGKPCLVVSNDDGVDSEATQLLASRLREEHPSLRVVLVAPHANCSAASMSLSLRRVMKVEHRTDIHQDTYALHGSPADSVLVALDPYKGILPLLGLSPILLVSGPNFGPNLSSDVLYSGTVGAARQAGFMGVPCIASSFLSPSKKADFSPAVEATVRVTTAALNLLQPETARNWPRDVTKYPQEGRRYVKGDISKFNDEDSSKLNRQQLIQDAFKSGDIILNVNVPTTWCPSNGEIVTTGFGLMAYHDVLTVQYQPNEVSLTADVGVGAASGVTGFPDMQYEYGGTLVKAEEGNGNGNGNGAGSGGMMGGIESGSGNVAQGTGPMKMQDGQVEYKVVDSTWGVPKAYNNRFGHQTTHAVIGSDINAVHDGMVSVSTIQTWPEGHPLGLRDQVMAAAPQQGKGGLPAWMEHSKL